MPQIPASSRGTAWSIGPDGAGGPGSLCFAAMDTHLSDLLHRCGLIVHLGATAVSLRPVLELDSFVPMDLGQDQSWVTTDGGQQAALTPPQCPATVEVGGRGCGPEPLRPTGRLNPWWKPLRHPALRGLPVSAPCSLRARWADHTENPALS